MQQMILITMLGHVSFCQTPSPPPGTETPPTPMRKNALEAEGDGG